MKRGEKIAEEKVFCASSMLTLEEKKELQGMIDQLGIKQPENMLMQFCEASEEKMEKDTYKLCYILECLAGSLSEGRPFPIKNMRIILFSWGHRFQCAVQHLVGAHSKEEVAEKLRVNHVISVVDRLYMDAPSTELDAICEEIDKKIRTNEEAWMTRYLPRLKQTVANLELQMTIDVSTDGQRDDRFVYWYRELLHLYVSNQRVPTADAAKRKNSSDYLKEQALVKSSITYVPRPGDADNKSFGDFFCLTQSREAAITKPVKKLAQTRLGQIVPDNYFSQGCASDTALKRELEGLLAVYILAGQIHVGLAFLPSTLNEEPCSLHMTLYSDNVPQRFLLDRLNNQRQRVPWKDQKLMQIVWAAPPKLKDSTLSPSLSCSQMTDTSGSSCSQETNDSPRVEVVGLSRGSAVSQGMSDSPRIEAVRCASPVPKLEIPPALVESSDVGNSSVVVDLARLSVMNREATEEFLKRAYAYGRKDIAAKVQDLTTHYEGVVMGIIANSVGGDQAEKPTRATGDPETSKQSFFSNASAFEPLLHDIRQESKGDARFKVATC